MQVLRHLYEITGRRAEWRRLVAEVTPDFTNEHTGHSVPGLEDSWVMVQEYRVPVLREDREWQGAEGIQRRLVEWRRERARPFLTQDPGTLTAAQQHLARTYAVSVEALSNILREQGSAECVDGYVEGFTLAEGVGDSAEAGICAFNLGHAYLQIEEIHDLDEAERWYRRSIQLTADSDRIRLSKGMAS